MPYKAKVTILIIKKYINSILSFPYNQEILDTVRFFPYKWWNANDKEWELPLDKLGQLVSLLPKEEFDITGPYVSMKKEVKVIDSPDRKLSAWIGGSAISSISSFKSQWITKAEYEDSGASIIRRKYA